LSTTTSSPRKPMTIEGAACSPSPAAVVKASTPRWTRVLGAGC
jgi:hypothetical protein